MDYIINSMENAKVTTKHWKRIKELLSSIQLRGHIISARDLYESTYPGLKTMWKMMAFEQVAEQHFKKDANNECSLISIGNMIHDFIAAEETQTHLQTECGIPCVSLNRLKLLEKPSLQMMMSQFGVLSKLLPALSPRSSSFDVDFIDYYSFI